MMDSILSLHNVCKRYKNSDFELKNVTFSVPYGSIMGLVGQNGSGKTTIINTILNIVFQDSGMIRLFGQEMTDQTREIREKIGVVFDANNYSGNVSAAELAKVMQKIYAGWDHALFLSYMDKFKLPLKQWTKAYSRGMSMQLAIALALSHRPKLLLLDEATSGLDPIIRDDILDVFLDFVQDESHSILLSSHITTDLEKVADYITFIHDGEVRLSAKKDDLLDHYAVLRSKPQQFEQIRKEDIVAFRKRDYHVDVLVANKTHMQRKYKEFILDDVSIEDIMLFIVKGDTQP